MNIKSYDKGAVIFRQGDPGDCMYDIQFGKVGIFDHYGEPDEKKIADLAADVQQTAPHLQGLSRSLPHRS